MRQLMRSDSVLHLSCDAVDGIFDIAGAKQPAFGDEKRRIEPSVALSPGIEAHRQAHILNHPNLWAYLLLQLA